MKDVFPEYCHYLHRWYVLGDGFEQIFAKNYMDARKISDKMNEWKTFIMPSIYTMSDREYFNEFMQEKPHIQYYPPVFSHYHGEWIIKNTMGSPDTFKLYANAAAFYNTLDSNYKSPYGIPNNTLERYNQMRHLEFSSPTYSAYHKSWVLSDNTDNVLEFNSYTEAQDYYVQLQIPTLIDDVETSIQRKPNGMNYSAAIVILNKDARVIECIYDPMNPDNTTMFKTLDSKIDVDDYVVVEAKSTRHKMVVVQVVKTDISVDVNDPTNLMWVVTRIDKEAHEAILEGEAAGIEQMKNFERKKKAEEYKIALGADLTDEPTQLLISNVGSTSNQEEGEKATDTPTV